MEFLDRGGGHFLLNKRVVSEVLVLLMKRCTEISMYKAAVISLMQCDKVVMKFVFFSCNERAQP